MHQLVKKTLESFINEKKILTTTDIPEELKEFASAKEAVFVTLYMSALL